MLCNLLFCSTGLRLKYVQAECNVHFVRTCAKKNLDHSVIPRQDYNHEMHPQQISLVSYIFFLFDDVSYQDISIDITMDLLFGQVN